MVLIPATVYAIVSNQARTYESSVLLAIHVPANDTSVFNALEAVTPAQAVLSAARLSTTTSVARAAASRLGESPSAARGLLDGVTATADAQAGFVAIVARAPDAERAADVANAFAMAVVNLRAGQAVRRVDATIADVERQLRGLRPADRVARTQLAEQLPRQRALRSAQGATTQVVDAAAAASSPVAPRIGRTVAMAAIVAVVLGFAAVGLAHGADRRVRDPRELEELAGVALLSTVPRPTMGDVQTSAAGQEPFQALRACLSAFNAGVEITSVLVASPGRLDGRTTVATNLARAMALAGSDVILVDADLRRPAVAARFDAGATVGLGGVLSGDASLDGALLDVDLDLPLGGRLRLLPAEPGLSHPSELLAGPRMTELLRQLDAIADVVVIDGAPVSTVGDALPLIAAVSGVVVVARLDATSKDAVRVLRRIVADAGGRLLGSVATGAATARGSRGGRSG
ncbi:MAG: tyrosine-protein kinase [Solirubrobacteraceae bacterium]|nr:tyrosine-protein kinase [Solirubrobacteraceae bacterium]